jgi:hypothetical protein
MQYENSEHWKLNCAAFKSRLDSVLDSWRSPQLDLPLRAHARDCRPCARWLATQMALLDSVQDISTPELRPDFALQVVQTVKIERQRQHRQRLRAMGYAAVAASVLIAVSIGRGPAVPEVVTSLPSASRPPKIPAEVLQRVDEVSQDFKPVSGSVYTALNAIWLAQRLL